MSSYAAWLGHQPHISIAELAALVPGFKLLERPDKKVIIFASTTELGPKLLDALGGTVLLAANCTPRNFKLTDIPKLMLSETSNVRGKTIFALRTVGLPSATTRKLYQVTKEAFKNRQRIVRYIGTDKKPAAAPLLHDSGLLTGKKGCELAIIKTETGLWVGRTIAAQNVDEYSKRDVGKPARDTLMGLLPPKLAQIMLNLGVWLITSQKTPKVAKKWKLNKYRVYDPFCGTGVIPLEAMYRGWEVLGSDTAKKAVNNCTKNLDWMRTELDLKKTEAPATVWQQDATKPFKVTGKPPDLIVTETSLGTPMVSRASQKIALKERAANEKLQADFLRNVANTWPKVPIVCTWPVWRLKTGPLFLEKIWDAVAELPYEVVQPITLEEHGRPTLFYRRSDQFVGREIVLLKPKQLENEKIRK